MSGAAAAEGSPERCVHGRMDKGELDLPGRGCIVPLRLCGSQRVGGDPSLMLEMTCVGVRCLVPLWLDGNQRVGGDPSLTLGMTG